MEFLQGGDLFVYLKGRRCSESQARFYIAQAVLCFEYLHSRAIVYRDLKPENFMLDSSGYVKLVAFSYAKQLCKDTDLTFTFCGTPEYLAPEIIQLKGHGVGVDWWTLGIFTYELLLGGPPFQEAQGQVVDLYRQILKNDIVIPHQYRISKDAQNLIRCLCHRDWTKRLGCTRNKSTGVKSRRFFSQLNFDALLHRSIPAPYIPRLVDPYDIRHFDVVDCDKAVPDDGISSGGERSSPASQLPTTAKDKSHHQLRREKRDILAVPEWG